ncbi:MAG: SDR family oxidoreductase [Spirochaetaceae bacterium]|nr:MAG: SDR family oxidoreductase [Spirochaetaceae bacterium]
MGDKSVDLFSLEGKVAVVTGGGGELCGTISEALAARGVKVAVLDINPEAAEARVAAIQKAGGEARAAACSVLDESQLTDVYEVLTAQWGPPDILINGAGGNNPRGSTSVSFLEAEHLGNSGAGTFLDLELDGFRGTFDLNFLGTFLPTKVFTRGMIERGSGSILNMASMSALTPLTKVGAYSAAKAAVANFTKWLAVHLSHTGVRVNALAPGFFMTEQLRFLHVDQTTGELTPRAKQVLARTPLGRYGDPKDLIGAVIWLLSDAAAFVTGVVLPIDGGFSAYSI